MYRIGQKLLTIARVRDTRVELSSSEPTAAVRVTSINWSASFSCREHQQQEQQRSESNADRSAVEAASAVQCTRACWPRPLQRGVTTHLPQYSSERRWCQITHSMYTHSGARPPLQRIAITPARSIESVQRFCKAMQ